MTYAYDRTYRLPHDCSLSHEARLVKQLKPKLETTPDLFAPLRSAFANALSSLSLLILVQFLLHIPIESLRLHHVPLQGLAAWDRSV